MKSEVLQEPFLEASPRPCKRGWLKTLPLPRDLLPTDTPTPQTAI